MLEFCRLKIIDYLPVSALVSADALDDAGGFKSGYMLSYHTFGDAGFLPKFGRCPVRIFSDEAEYCRCCVRYSCKRVIRNFIRNFLL